DQSLWRGQRHRHQQQQAGRNAERRVRAAFPRSRGPSLHGAGSRRAISPPHPLQPGHWPGRTPAFGNRRLPRHHARRARVCRASAGEEAGRRYRTLCLNGTTSMTSPIRVLIVDDSALMRQLLSTLLAADPEIQVVGTAQDPFDARDKIKALNPDIITLDVEMPGMDGLTFLRKIMALRPMPVVMFSSLTQAGAEATLEALEIGAVDFVAKPTHDVANAMGALAETLQAKIKAAARARFPPRRAGAAPAPRGRPKIGRPTGKLLLIGASTGGVEALKALLLQLPEDCPPSLITQHMPERFTSAFAQRLDRECPMTVSEAKDGDRLETGHVFIAPGGAHHLELNRNGGHYFCKLVDGPLVSGHRPSVDVLFRSGARLTARTIIAVILTGMGKDGAQGMLELRQAGATTFGQDEGSSLVYGMPRAAFECGAVMRQYPLAKMGDVIVDACKGEGGASIKRASA